MATKVINDYASAISLDAANDYFLIQQAGVYKRVNRNVMLGITGAPVGNSDTQTLTNKTIGNTNPITAKTNGFTLQDGVDSTKQATFNLSGNTTATTRIYTFPNASSSIADLTTVQTLTNKTITSPVITGGTISNATITVDSISGFTTPTIVTIGGVQMNNGQIATAGAVVTNSIADTAVTPAKLQAGTGSGWTWQSWVPTWTNLTVSTATVNAKYVQVGKMVQCRLSIIFAAGTSISGNPLFTLPVTSVSYPVANISPLGSGTINDNGSAQYGCTVKWNSTTRALIESWDDAATGVRVDTAISATAPMTWTVSDGFELNFTYEAA